LKNFIDVLPEEALRKMGKEEMNGFQRGLEVGLRTEEGIIVALTLGAILLININPVSSVFLALLITNMSLSAIAGEITLEKSERIEAEKLGRKSAKGKFGIKDALSILWNAKKSPRRVFVALWVSIDCLIFRKARSRLSTYFKL
jgi:hypothetical protein